MTAQPSVYTSVRDAKSATTAFIGFLLNLVKVKESLTGPVGPRGFQEVYAPRFPWHSAHEGGDVVSLTHRPPLLLVNVPGTHFHKGLSRPKGHGMVGRNMHQIWYSSYLQKSVPVAARSKTSVYVRSPAEIVGSNPTGGMDVCCGCCV